jgi:hypothetical protein
MRELFIMENKQGNNIFGNKASDGLGMWMAMKIFQQLHFNIILFVDVKLSGSNMKNLWIYIGLRFELFHFLCLGYV